eukprot:scaffold343798_cov20-Prasinocladus_malaysianus.AAC.1
MRKALRAKKSSSQLAKTMIAWDSLYCGEQCQIALIDMTCTENNDIDRSHCPPCLAFLALTLASND